MTDQLYYYRNDFRTYDEEAAYVSAWDEYDNGFGSTSDREVLAWSTAWFAAREFIENRDRYESESEIAEEKITLSDLRFREMALSLATQGAAGETPSSTVARAEAFLGFLTGRKSETDK